jgi:hypothetical protein
MARGGSGARVCAADWSRALSEKVSEKPSPSAEGGASNESVGAEGQSPYLPPRRGMVACGR